MAVLFLLSICVLSGSLGAFASESNHLIGSLVLLVALLVMFPSLLKRTGIRASKKDLFALVSIVTALTMLVIGGSPLVWIAAVCLLAFGMSGWGEGQASAQWAIVGLTAGLYFVLFAFFSPLEPFWRLNLKASLFATQKLGALTNHALALGPSASGWWVCLLFLCYFLATLIVENRKRKFLVGILSVLAVFVAFNLINLHYPLLRSHTHTGLNLFNSQIVCFVLGASILYFFHRKASTPTVVEIMPRRRFILLVQALVVLSVTAYHLATNGERGEAGGRIVIYGTKPSASYDVPSFDRLGIQASGMYGLLPKYLRAAGFEVAVVEEIEKLPDLIDQARTLVIISPTEILPPQLHERIWNFVKDGGGLLVMGDHTDIFGTRRPLNNLLAPIRVSFNFDSAYPARKAWRYCYERFPHPVTRSLDQVNDVLAYGTGASLAIKAPAYPVVVGKYGFSDKGNYANSGRGAFLGDYAYQRGEQLGDVVLVAGAGYGRGKVLVFGDTSSFQNVSVPYSYPFLADVFTWLSSRGVLNHTAHTFLAFVLIALAVMVLTLGGHVTQSVPMTITALTLTVSVFVSAELTPSTKVPKIVPDRSHHVAYVDGSHIGSFKMEHWERESIDGLLVNLSRNGYLPVIMREFSPAWLKASEIYVSISPIRSYSKDEITALERFVTDGGTALLAVGYEESAGAQKLLRHFGFRIGLMPLGAAPITDFIPDAQAFQKIMQEPHFMEAWPVEVTDGAAHEVLYSYKDFPIVVTKNRGRGRIVVIGDTRFLHDETLENEKAAWPGNVEFLKKVLLRQAG